MAKTVPHPFQLEGVKRIHELDLRCLLADSTGLGKTLQSLLAVAERPDLRPAVIVCPASLKLVWEAQAMQHLGMRIDVLSGRGGKDTPWFVSPNVVVVNYDILHDWLPALEAIKPKIVVADEAQMLANPETKRTRAMKRLVGGVKHFIAISATPCTIRPIQLWPVLNMLDPKRWTSRGAYGLRYCGGRRTPWGMDFSRATNTKELHNVLTKTLMIRRLKQDVLKDLPAKTRSMVPLRLSPSDMRQYKSAEQNLIAWLRLNYGAGVAKRASRVEAMAQVGYLKRLAANLKMAQCVDWIKDFLSTGEKLLVAVIHKTVGAALHEQFKKEAVRVFGETPMDQRQAAFKAFNKPNGRIRLCVGNIQAAGTGWSASDCSNVAVMEYPWAPGEVTQFEDRCYGMYRGKEGVPMTAWWLAAQSTIEPSLVARLIQRQGALDSVLDGKGVENFDAFDAFLSDLKGKK